MSITYRDGTAADATAIDAIFQTTFCDTFAHLYRPEDLNAFLAKFTPESWVAELTDRGFAFRVAQVAGKPVGYAKLGPLGLPVEARSPAMELRQLYILKDWHGAGIARELMDWCLGEAGRRGAAELYLSVYTDNFRARRFYDRYGFELVGPYAFMVGEQADEDLIMRLKL